MVYIRLHVKEGRLGNWLLSYASAVTQRPDDPVTFVLVNESSAEDHDPRKRSELWPDAKYETCDGKKCSTCSKCIKQCWGVEAFDQKTVQRRLRCPDRIKRQICDEFVSVHPNQSCFLGQWLPGPVLGSPFSPEARFKTGQGA